VCVAGDRTKKSRKKIPGDGPGHGEKTTSTIDP
jgi:hypothetical protein